MELTELLIIFFCIAGASFGGYAAGKKHGITNTIQFLESHVHKKTKIIKIRITDDIFEIMPHEQAS